MVSQGITTGLSVTWKVRVWAARSQFQVTVKELRVVLPLSVSIRMPVFCFTVCLTQFHFSWVIALKTRGSHAFIGSAPFAMIFYFLSSRLDQSLLGHQPHHHCETGQHDYKVGGYTRIRMFWRILREQPPGCARSHCQKDFLTRREINPDTDRKHQKSLDFAQGKRSLAPIEHPDRDEVEHVEPCPGESQRSPQRVTCLITNQGATRSREP